MFFRQLEYLVTLAREKHFARAAACCHVSQPALSTAIRHLEEELGVIIVRRGQRFLGFTPEGERILAWARHSLASLFGFHLGVAARDRRWLTSSDKAQFRIHGLPKDTAMHRAKAQYGDRVLTLWTIRSHDQYNTTVYGLDGRYCGVFGQRRVLAHES